MEALQLQSFDDGNTIEYSSEERELILKACEIYQKNIKLYYKEFGFIVSEKLIYDSENLTILIGSRAIHITCSLNTLHTLLSAIIVYQFYVYQLYLTATERIAINEIERKIWELMLPYLTIKEDET